MEVPYLFLKQQNKELKSRILKKISSDLDRSYFILGPETKKFERNFAKLIGTKYALGVNSGTDALLLSLKAIGIQKGEEVITVSNSFIATANAVKLTGAEPIFVDVKENLLINEDIIENKISNKTKAIIPVHLTGSPCNMTKIMNIAKKNNIRVIEDSAQAIGAQWKRKCVGTFDIGAFSLHPLKNLSACGDGGIVTTNDKNIYQKIKLLRNHGLKSRNNPALVGFNSRLDELQASILNIKIKYLEKITHQRRENANLYTKLLREIPQIKSLPEEGRNEYAVYHTYVLRVRRRDELMKYLLNNAIECKIHYPKPIHLQNSYKNIRLEKTEKFSKEIISLPIHQYLNRNQIRFVVDKIREFYKNS